MAQRVRAALYAIGQAHTMKFSRVAPEAPEINLIPFIDILLVIVIFLVLTTSYQRFTGLSITLPVAERQTDTPRSTRINLAIDAQGRISVNGLAFVGQTIVDLRSTLQALAPSGTDAVVLVNADAQVAHQRVVDVMTAARMAGLAKIVFAAQTHSP